MPDFFVVFKNSIYFIEIFQGFAGVAFNGKVCMKVGNELFIEFFQS